MAILTPNPMTLLDAYAMAIGMKHPTRVEDAMEAISILEAHPEYLTNGEACRGLDRLRRFVYLHEQE